MMFPQSRHSVRGGDPRGGALGCNQKVGCVRGGLQGGAIMPGGAREGLHAKELDNNDWGAGGGENLGYRVGQEMVAG